MKQEGWFGGEGIEMEIKEEERDQGVIVIKGKTC
jgi:hypothetical protein